MSNEEKENAKALAKEIGELTAAITRALPVENEDQAREYIELIKEGIDNAMAKPADDAKAPVKDIAENVVDVLEAVGPLIPDSTDKNKQRAKRRYIHAVGVIRSLLRLFGLD